MIQICIHPAKAVGGFAGNWGGQPVSWQPVSSLRMELSEALSTGSNALPGLTRILKNYI